jgi:hypothetical protein
VRGLAALLPVETGDTCEFVRNKRAENVGCREALSNLASGSSRSRSNMLPKASGFISSASSLIAR